MYHTKLSFLTLVLAATTLLSGCASKGKPLTESSQPQLTYKSSHYVALKSLPKTTHKIPVSVYNFRDQTGQYKPQANVSSFSTSVTQGATSILTEALLDSDWFLPIEREGLQNLLTERKIIRASKKIDNNAAMELAPLKTASYIFEGGIIGYDSNIKTGGAGVGYYGFNVGEMYREDQVHIYLRLVEVNSGAVLASVSTTKTILSQELRTGFFRYISLYRLAEAEAGFTTNEPVYTCVLQAIQKAVTSIIFEGVEKGIWDFNDPMDLQSEAYLSYLQQKKDDFHYLQNIADKHVAKEETEIPENNNPFEQSSEFDAEFY
ncbi:MAG: CsgG/HfaB family protein [Pseudomonadota bacterium]